jgi:hypothetical protein
VPDPPSVSPRGKLATHDTVQHGMGFGYGGEGMPGLGVQRRRLCETFRTRENA